MRENAFEKKKSIIENIVYRSNKEEKKGNNCTQLGYYSFIYGYILGSN